MSENNNEENKKAIEVKMYFSSMETVLKHLSSINPTTRMEEALRYLYYALTQNQDKDTKYRISDVKLNLEKELVAFNETVSNLLMVVDTYLTMNETNE